MTNNEFEVRWQLEVRVTRTLILHKRKQANKHSGQGQGHYDYQSGFPPNPKTNTDIFRSLHGNGIPALKRHLPKFRNKKRSTVSVLLLVLPLSSCTIVTQPVLKRDVPAKQFWCLCLCALSFPGSQSSIYGVTDHYLKNRWRVMKMDLPATFVAQFFFIWIKKTKS